jgi:protein-tyrosine phosphatase
MVVRFVRARKEAEQAELERQMRKEWEEMKQKEHDAKHTGEGKGFVYRMLL